MIIKINIKQNSIRSLHYANMLFIYTDVTIASNMYALQKKNTKITEAAEKDVTFQIM